jgi:hypothetical protein
MSSNMGCQVGCLTKALVAVFTAVWFLATMGSQVSLERAGTGVGFTWNELDEDESDS